MKKTNKVEEEKNKILDMTPGDTIKVFEKIMESGKRKSQTFEGVLIAKKHGNGPNATFTLRAVIGGIGVEKTYPLHSPLIEKIQVVKRGKARRAKLYYLRDKAEKEIRKKLKSQRVIEKKEPQVNKEEEAKGVKPEKVKEKKEDSKKKDGNNASSKKEEKKK